MMKNADVKIGGKYYANVTKKEVQVQIESVNDEGGWNATNLSTGKTIHIKNADRLLRSVGRQRAKGSASVTQEGNLTIVEVPSVRAETIGEKSFAAPKPANSKRGLSCIEAAHRVLLESDAPLNAKQLIQLMSEQEYWSSPGGKTPHATLYSAILRELAKGSESRFIKKDRGLFAAQA